jgi:hypothetical protein
MAGSLALSKAMMGIVMGTILLNWLIEGDFAKKLKILKQKKSALLLLSVYFIFLLGFSYTSSIKWGLNDLRIQLPLLIFPLVVSTSKPLDYKQLKTIIYVFSGAVLIASLCSLFIISGFTDKIIRSPRDLSPFISHIRFALLINFSIFSLAWYFWNAKQEKLIEKILLGLVIVWLSVYLVLLKSVTGWVVFFSVSSLLTIYGIYRISKVWVRSFLAIILFAFIAIPVIYIRNVVNQFYQIETIPSTIGNDLTKNGNPYINDFQNKQIENGHYIYLYINENELREAWNQRSTIDYDSTSIKGFHKDILIRYLTSKGFRKDAEGIAKLTEYDIKNIENGISNYKLTTHGEIFKRIYPIIWEIDVYRKGGNPSGHSVTQRLEYYKMAIQIINEHFWFGNGSGGYFEAYQKKYNENSFFNSQKYRQRSHNMFLSYWIDFGLIGLILICFAMFSPIFIERKTENYLIMVFILIFLVSFMNEDTLNNHDAINFFSLFYSLLLFSNSEA